VLEHLVSGGEKCVVPSCSLFPDAPCGSITEVGPGVHSIESRSISWRGWLGTSASMFAVLVDVSIVYSQNAPPNVQTIKGCRVLAAAGLEQCRMRSVPGAAGFELPN
jgi:hypothetical protein